MSSPGIKCDKGSDAKCTTTDTCCASLEMTKMPEGYTQAQKDLAKTMFEALNMPGAVGDKSYLCAPVADIKKNDGVLE